MGDTTNPQDRKSYAQWGFNTEKVRIAQAIRTRIGSGLQETYRHLVQERLPPKIADLLRRLEGSRD